MLLRRRDLPLGRDASGRFLPWLIGVMVYLAALALVGGLAMNKIAERWDAGLSNNLTVQVPAPAPGAPLDSTEQATERLLALLRETPGIASADALGSDEIATLLEPWLGPPSAYRDLPMPGLIAVVLEPDARPDLRALDKAIGETVPGASLDDHRSWLAELLDLAHTIQLIALLVVGLVGAAAVSMVVFTTRMGLSIHAPVIELLHLIGAQDRYIAREFQGHALLLALRGGLVGLALAVATALLLDQVMARGDIALLPGLSLGPLDWSLLALLPFLVAGIALVTARLTVLRTLGRLP